jgi:antitoxin component YwqK of YwqJK toxin-antitoxin module
LSSSPPAIPDHAEEHIRTTWDDGGRKSADYLLDGRRVGHRSWGEAGQLLMEYAVEDDQMHGPFRTWHDNGQLCERGWYERGREHGTSEQYNEAGALIGSYTMEHGTGVDLWFIRPGLISEERHCRDGRRHGPERWWNEDNRTVAEEGHYAEGLEHGIFRAWNASGRLRRGYPRYFVAGRRVRKAAYERARRGDPGLPPFRAEENRPERTPPTLTTSS